MTLRHYGKATPLQIDMLCLGGEVLVRHTNEPPTDRERLDRMKKARRLLKLQTGQDFGYDLAAWHHFLLNYARTAKQYKLDYNRKVYRQRIDELFNDPDRLRLVRLLEEQQDVDADQR
jgi:hypothetical protein